jgi:hypothetical protein
MKKIRLIACALAIASFGFTSCDDDDDPVYYPTDLGIAGTYNLTAVNTGSPTDFNEDGTENENQMLESNCYNGSRIILNADGTFVYDIRQILVDTGSGSSACDDYTVLGTWVLEGGTGTSAVLTLNYEEEDGDDVEVTVNKTGGQLQIYSLLAQYPDRNADGGAIYAIGELELLFTKQ